MAIKPKRRPVLHPDPCDPEWDEFCDALYAELGDNYEYCLAAVNHGARHYYATHLLAERGFDVEASLALYEKRGGYCDCEILLNVDQSEEELAGDEA